MKAQKKYRESEKEYELHKIEILKPKFNIKILKNIFLNNFISFSSEKLINRLWIQNPFKTEGKDAIAPFDQISTIWVPNKAFYRGK